MRATADGQLFANIAATTSGFALSGGLYSLNAVATWGGGNVALQVLGPDATTWITALTALTANGGTTGYLPSGQYRVAVTTATAVYAALSRIPGD